ncbi:polyphosphate kinase [Rubritalea squalenifaciens DSM 18772]|uniref:Polyphosphate kinase n=1 Tax=Rubritalea squalenifaciens DSM 18772 TaxID=1123071 RepID=A0A1M6RMZ3_9BACT|nr:polyphosphate kinase 1 [Rubritalea squalenifaciens]SHK33819.1 polyphosphate kinase [Rubritalea squalenifaciens DSM 18772]
MSANYINRELSWLEFNQRVLSEAQREDLPLLERVKFLAITASNLDEFFQVRVGGLTILRRTGNRKPDFSGLTPLQQLSAIRTRTKKMIADQYSLLNDTLLPELERHNILFKHPRTLSPFLSEQLSERTKEQIIPLLTPLAYDEDQTDPELPALRLIVACTLQDDESLEQRHAFIPIPDHLGRIIYLSENDQQIIVLLEDVIAHYASYLFPGETAVSHSTFKITRNGDIAVHEEDAIDLAGEMEDVLAERKVSNTVRLEFPKGTSRDLESLIKKVTHAPSKSVFKIPGPLALNDFMEIAFLSGHDELKDPVWEPQPSSMLDPQVSMFDSISEQDILLYHPYESFEPVIRLLEEAATDPDVLSIKQVLYRTAKQSRIIDALIKAAENGKQVTVLVELKARFDEARNLQRADELQRAGVQIVYGVKGLKTHAKITLIIRNEGGQLMRYCHLGTGNYNESTAKLYTDASYLTCRKEYGADASLFFNAVTGRSKLIDFSRIVPAPTHMKRKLLELIASETARAKQGEEASITAKVNSLQDQDIIDALYQAAQAGVSVRLNIRGICCLKTSKSTEASNIKVVSVIDRYLEHARIFSFHQGGSPQMYISSADWMTRNLEKRVELMIPILEKNAQRRLTNILEAAFKDNQQAHLILPDGTSARITDRPKKKFRMQKDLQERAEKAAKSRAQRLSTTFEPHLPANG